MLKSDFFYRLPDRLIAQKPLPQRTASRLLCVTGKTGKLTDRLFVDLVSLVNPGDLLIFNDTRVIPARLLGKKATGGRVEILVERILDVGRIKAHLRASKIPKTGATIFLDGGCACTVVGRDGDLFDISIESIESVESLLQRIGHVPLPPYITRRDCEEDQRRYQTVYANKIGAVAAPTAGLHFDLSFKDSLRRKGVGMAYITLHVGSGTFKPVRTEILKDHNMHAEIVEVTEATVQQVAAVRSSGGRIIAVGTTVVRALETAIREDELRPYSGETKLFITPGFRFSCIDALVTNFHLPESTLLMLVCAFAGYRPVMDAYHHAVAQEYRFFSYGDAMFLTAAKEG